MTTYDGPPAEVVEYDPAWPAAFELIRGHLDAALGGIEHRVEHVGSTAVPGLSAKPIIDLDVVVERAAVVPEVIEALRPAGYEHEGDLGISGREGFTVAPGLPYHHLYVVVRNTPPHRDHVDLRDYLRAHPEAVEAYARRKRELAGLLRTDRAAYVAGKSALVQDLLRRARGN